MLVLVSKLYLGVYIWGTNGTLVEVSVVETFSQTHTDDLLFMYVVETLCEVAV